MDSRTINYVFIKTIHKRILHIKQDQQRRVFLGISVHLCQLGDSLTIISARLHKLLWVILWFLLKNFVTSWFNTLLHMQE